MSHEVDRSYYQRRAQDEREKAKRASDQSIRRSHELLAGVYERKVEDLLSGIARIDSDQRR